MLYSLMYIPQRKYILLRNHCYRNCNCIKIVIIIHKSRNVKANGRTKRLNSSTSFNFSERDLTYNLIFRTANTPDISNDFV